MESRRHTFEPQPLADGSITWFRRALAFTWLWTLLVKIQDLDAHYTDAGVLPRALLESSVWKLSLNMLSGSATWQWCLFILAIVVSVANFFGVKPTWTSFVMWILGISVFSRNEIVMNGADHYFAMLLFWNWVLSWARVRSWSGAAYVLQIVMLYFFTGFAKIHFESWADGTAMRDILNLDILTRPWAQSLVTSDALMKGMTWLTLATEFLAAAGLLVSWFALSLNRTSWSARVRIVTLFALAGLHIGIVAMLKLYFIPITSLVALMPLWPARSRRAVSLPKRILMARAQAVCIAVVSIIFLISNIQGDPRGLLTLPRGYAAATAALRLDQNWTFYAPPPTPGFDGWWVIRGETENGEIFDAWTGRAGPVDEAKPKVLSAYYVNQHWTAYFINLSDPQNDRYVAGLLDYLCREKSKVEVGGTAKKITAEKFYSIYDARPVSVNKFEHRCELSGLY